jgi:hypothetical protein
LKLVENSAQLADERALGRLRHAIAAEDEEDEEEQLKGVLRMLGAEIPDKTQLAMIRRQGPDPSSAAT